MYVSYIAADTCRAKKPFMCMYIHDGLFVARIDSVHVYMYSYGHIHAVLSVSPCFIIKQKLVCDL